MISHLCDIKEFSDELKKCVNFYKPGLFNKNNILKLTDENILLTKDKIFFAMIDKFYLQ